MKKAYLLLLILPLLAVSCNKKDTRLTGYSAETMVSWIKNAENFSVTYLLDSTDKVGIEKNAETMTIVEENIVYKIDGERYLSTETEKELDLSDDAFQNIEYFVENYAYSYKNFIDDMTYQETVDVGGYSCYLYYLPMAGNDGEALGGVAYTIEKESGILVSRTYYGETENTMAEMISELTSVNFQIR